MRAAGGVLRELLKHYGLEARLEGFKAAECWPELVGLAFASRTTVKNYENGRLIIEAHGAAVMQELLMMRSGLLRAFAEKHGAGLVKEIHFVPAGGGRTRE